jgi:hypothetical protein
MKKYTFFSSFQGGWPIRDLMKKMLQNSVNSLKADWRAEALAEEEDSDWEEQDEPAAPKRKKASRKPSKMQPESDAESDDDRELDWIDDEGDSDLDEEGSDDEVVVKKSDSRKVSQSERIPNFSQQFLQSTGNMNVNSHGNIFPQFTPIDGFPESIKQGNEACSLT